MTVQSASAARACTVIPAQAGIQCSAGWLQCIDGWTPAYAGVTGTPAYTGVTWPPAYAGVTGT